MPSIDKKIFGTLFFSVFATVTGVGIVVPFLPVYAHSLGAGGFAIGLIFGAFSISRTFFLPYFGRLSDLNGRKPFITTGLLLYTLIAFVFIWADTVPVLIIVRFLQGIASAMIMPVVQAYVGDITPKGREGAVMGLFNVSVFAGLSLGPLMGGILSDHLGLAATFATMGVLSLVGFFLSWMALPSTKEERIPARSAPPAALRQIITDPLVLRLAGFRMAYTTAIGIIWGFLPVLGSVQLGFSSTTVGILVMEGVLVSGLLHMPMGYLADRIHRRKMMIIGGLLVVLAMAALIWATTFWHFFWANLIFGVGGGISMPALMALTVVKGDQDNAMGSVMALMVMAHSFGMMLGAMTAGIMMDFISLRQAFFLGMLFMAIMTAWVTCSPKPFKNIGGRLADVFPKAAPKPPLPLGDEPR